MTVGVTFHVTIDPAKLAVAVKDDGGFFRYGLQQAEKVKIEAQRLVHVGKQLPGPDRGRRPGTLRDSIVKRVQSNTAAGWVITVGSDDPIALFHHEGTQPHTITPHRGPRLVFFSPKAGRVVYAKIVHHPGTKPNPFLRNALHVLH